MKKASGVAVFRAGGISRNYPLDAGWIVPIFSMSWCWLILIDDRHIDHFQNKNSNKKYKKERKERERESFIIQFVYDDSVLYVVH